MIQSFLGIAAGIIASTAFIPYIISILKGETRPQRATFAVWSSISLVILFSYFASGARETIWIALVYAIFQTSVFILSLKYGMGGLGKLDLVCLSGALVGILAWIITEDPATALYASIGVELLGWIPLYKKAYLQPKTENTLSWVIGLVAAVLNLFAITSLEFNIVLYPVYVFVTETALVLLLLLPRLRARSKEV